MSRPEILAPAGDRPALAAALAAGADAVYFGLDDGFNARARAANFPSDDLAATLLLIHRANARAFVALNTLVFEPELPIVEQLIRRIAAAGVDAIIVQDPAVALLARAICPALEVHASTQMTASSPLAAELLRPLGLSRVVVPRELSIDEIRAYAAGTSLSLEVFVHGALCVAWSGQCLSSEVWGGRSANRGQCAQACRLPYSLVVDDQTRDLGDVAYLLSPKDLNGVDAVPALAEIGVASLKIEGRLKGPAYVATTVARYRAASDASATDDVAATAAATAAAAAAREGVVSASRWRSPVEIPVDDFSMEIAYSRGKSLGFLGGADHQTLVEGRFPRHRGWPAGRVVRVEPGAVVVERDPEQRPITGGRAVGSLHSRASESESSEPRTPSSDARTISSETRTSSSEPRTAFVPRAGMGVVFDRGRPEDPEEGGPIFGVDVLNGGRLRLEFGRPGPDLDKVKAGDFVWVNSDPVINKAGDQASAIGFEPLGRIPVELEIRGTAGSPLVVTARIRRAHHVQPPVRGQPTESSTPHEVPSSESRDNNRHNDTPGSSIAAVPDARATSASNLQPARGAGLTAELLADKLGGFGGTDFHLAAIDTSGLAAGLHLPVSELKDIRRRLLPELDAAIARIDRTVASGSVIEQLRAEHRAAASEVEPIVVPLCRTDAQLDAVIAAGAHEVELDWMELVGLAKAVERARAAGLRVGVATVRVQKPGEERIDAHLARLEPDHVLVRSWGSLAYFARLPKAPALHGDFSLNVTNSITAGWVLARGLATVTAAHDLDRTQLMAMLERVGRGRVAVTVHHHIPTFHTEHCVYAHLLSTGNDFRTCGRPCEEHQVALRDRVGLVHPVVVDVGCRNTVFNAQAQSAASLVPELLEHGVRRFRVELVRETAAEASRVYEAYRGLVAGTIAPAETVRRAAVHEQFGVTRGTMRTLTVLR